MTKRCLFVSFVVLTCCALSFGQAVIVSGSIALGVNATGELNASNGVFTTANTGGLIGVAFKFPDGAFRDVTAPGCPCEGWGVSANGIIGHADQNFGGAVNLPLVSFTSTATTAISTVTMGPLQIVQNYHPAASAPNNVFEDTVTITNTSSAVATDVRYTRVMDWDVPPTEFNEYVSIGGWPATNLLATGDNGFVNPDPLNTTNLNFAGCPVNANFDECGPADHGAAFIFGFGDLNAGDSKTFSIFYGGGDSKAAALALLGAVGAEVYSLGLNGLSTRDTDPAFLFGFKGVGGTPVPGVPEPASMTLLASGALAIISRLRRRK